MEHLSFQHEDRLGILTIRRPEALNALNSAVLRELEEFLRVHCYRHDIRALIITGAGEKAFVAGADIKEMQGLSHLEMLRFAEHGQELMRSLESAPFLTIAAVNGFALGGGLELALACDFIYASEKAKLGLPETTLGIIPAFGGTQRLSRAVGTRRAKELVMSGRIITAQEALTLGIVNRICPAASLMDQAQETAREIISRPLNALLAAKNVIDRGYDINMNDAMALERSACAVCFATTDRAEGMSAFVEKRQPQFA